MQPAVVSARWSGEEETLSMSSAFYLADMLSQSLYVLTLLPELPTRRSFSVLTLSLVLALERLMVTVCVADAAVLLYSSAIWLVLIRLILLQT